MLKSKLCVEILFTQHTSGYRFRHHDLFSRPRLCTVIQLEAAMKIFCTLAFSALLAAGNAAHACDISFNIILETFGEGVLVELRSGVPGRSNVVSSIKSSGGAVGFSSLCPGSYFLAIGNEESVSVTPTRNFNANMKYSSRITLQRGSGNVGRQPRKSL